MNTPSTASRNAPDDELGDLEQAQLGERVVDDRHHARRPRPPWPAGPRWPARTAPEALGGGQAPRRHEHVDQDRVQDQLLELAAPLQQREVRAGVLERPGLLDHPELVGAGVRLHRDPAGLVQDHHEQRGRGQQVRRPDDLPGAGPDRRGQRVRQVGAGQQGHGEHHEQHYRLGDRPRTSWPGSTRAARTGCRSPAPRSRPRSWPATAGTRRPGCRPCSPSGSP